MFINVYIVNDIFMWFFIIILKFKIFNIIYILKFFLIFYVIYFDGWIGYSDEYYIYVYCELVIYL